MKVFDLLNTPLEGSNLIEASAGTGKTYNIVGLFVRLILEKELTVRDILVVTYTIAATDELRDRIRRLLVLTERDLLARESQDTFVAGLIHKILLSGREDTARRLLRAAIRDFDEAAIHTIHGFCHRMLREYAFESGSLFEMDLLPDEDAVKREFARDFWRRHFYTAAPEFVAYCLEKKMSPDHYLALLKEVGLHATATIIPEFPQPDTALLESEIGRFHSLLRQTRQLWEKEKATIAKLLGPPGLKATVFGKKTDKILGSLDAFFRQKKQGFILPPDLEKVSTKKIEANTRKGYPPPEHPFFDLVEQLLDHVASLSQLFDVHLHCLSRKIVRQGQMELSLRKKSVNVLTYDDLLNDLHGALHSEKGLRLAGKIRTRFQAVLIDEFQDTDPVQYAIFKALFLENELEERRPVFVIGDPKQAIYAFRGADIFAYIEAARSMDHVYTLKENWRSEPDLLSALNVLFGTPRNPFLNKEIRYFPVSAAGRPDRATLTIDGHRETPFHWWIIPEESEANPNEVLPKDRQGQKGLAKTKQYPRVAAAVASEIARLLRLGREGRALIGEKPVEAADIAILVRTNGEVTIMRNALIDLNIPHVISSPNSVFHTSEAEDVRRILCALAEPANPFLLRAALVTDIIGMTGNDIHNLSLDEFAWEEILRRFHRFHALWDILGFIRMFRSFLDNEHLPSKILKKVDGERRLTNLLHIGELLHQAERSEHLTMHGLIKWLDDQIQTTDTQPEEYELRLDRDAKAVQVVTIHKSKGLEYPIVFCPFSWGSGGGRKKEDYLLYHDPDRSFAPILDFGSEKFTEHRRLHEEECLAEDIRLLYVALSRARHRVYFIWGRMSYLQRSAPVYLFHQPPDLEEGDLVRAVQERFRNLSHGDFRRDIQSIVALAPDAIESQALPEIREKPRYPEAVRDPFFCRRFMGKIDTTWRVASYTLLTSTREDRLSRIDDDFISQWEMKPEPEEESPVKSPSDSAQLDFYGFPGGTRSGILLHEILEKIDYRGNNSALTQEIIEKTLGRYGYDLKWLTVLQDMSEKVTTAPFPLFNGGHDHLTLSRIRPEDRRNEVEFYFPLKPISSNGLADLFHKGAAMPESALSEGPRLRCLERLQFSPLEGYLKGFIDLIFRYNGRFYLLDWKSNYLGNRPQNYSRDRLWKVMDEGFYFIQYHLYALVLHRYLALRIPKYDYDEHFGGIYYCFLRGMAPENEGKSGIFCDRPPLEMLDAMGKALIRTPSPASDV